MQDPGTNSSTAIIIIIIITPCFIRSMVLLIIRRRHCLCYYKKWENIIPQRTMPRERNLTENQDILTSLEKQEKGRKFEGVERIHSLPATQRDGACFPDAGITKGTWQSYWM